MNHLMPEDLPKGFLSYLGIDMPLLEKIVITIEVGKPVMVEIKAGIDRHALIYKDETGALR
jgi:hypothetical protein